MQLLAVLIVLASASGVVPQGVPQGVPAGVLQGAPQGTPQSGLLGGAALTFGILGLGGVSVRTLGFPGVQGVGSRAFGVADIHGAGTPTLGALGLQGVTPPSLGVVGHQVDAARTLGLRGLQSVLDAAVGGLIAADADANAGLEGSLDLPMPEDRSSELGLKTTRSALDSLAARVPTTAHSLSAFLAASSAGGSEGPTAASAPRTPSTTPSSAMPRAGGGEPDAAKGSAGDAQTGPVPAVGLSLNLPMGLGKVNFAFSNVDGASGHQEHAVRSGDAGGGGSGGSGGGGGSGGSGGGGGPARWLMGLSRVLGAAFQGSGSRIRAGFQAGVTDDGLDTRSHVGVRLG